MRQPYLRGIVANEAWENSPEVEHIHFFECYIGNYAGSEHHKITALCDLLNGL